MPGQVTTPNRTSSPTSDGITFRALSVCLVYPSAEIRSGVTSVLEVLLREPSFGGGTVEGLRSLSRRLETSELLDCQEQYLVLFDRTRSLSLHLYEHVHGDSKERGQAMVELSAVYAAQGYALESNEMPDYLPALLEFCSLVPRELAVGILSDTAALLRRIHRALVLRQSDYAAVFSALLELANSAESVETVASDELEVNCQPDDFLTLDKQWEEQPVLFNEGAAHDSCDPLRRSRPGSVEQPRGEAVVSLRSSREGAALNAATQEQ